jgi:rod shape-determining protein MreD
MPRILSGRVVLYLVFLLVLDLSVTPLIRVGGFRPILQYLVILYAAFQWGWEKTIPMAIGVGILRDLTSSQILGLETVSLVFVAFLLDLLVQKIERDIFFLRVLAVFLFVFSVLMMNLILSNFLTDIPRFSWYEIGIAVGTSLYTAAVMPLFFYGTRYWFHDRTFLKQYELFR